MNYTNSTSIPIWIQYFGLFCGFGLQILCFFGIIGNGLSVLVFLQRNFRYISLNIFLAALSFADLILLIFAIPVFTTGPLLFYFDNYWLYKANIYSTVYLYPVAITFQCISIWLLMLITFERWLAVCKPFLVTAYCTRTRAIIGIAFVVILSVIYNFVRFFEFSLDQFGNTLIYSGVRSSPAYLLWYSTVSWLLLSFVIPLGFLATMNGFVVREIVRAHQQRRLMSKQGHHVNKREEERRSTTTMLLYVILIFAFCYTLSFCLSVTEILKPSLFRSEFGFVVTDLNNFLGLLNSATSAIFYLRFSCRFRYTLCQLLFSNLPLSLTPLVSMYRPRCGTSPTFSRSRNGTASSSRMASGDEFIVKNGHAKRHGQQSLPTEKKIVLKTFEIIMEEDSAGFLKPPQVRRHAKLNSERRRSSSIPL